MVRTKESPVDEAVGQLMGTQIRGDHIVVTLQIISKIELPVSAKTSFRSFKIGETVGILLMGNRADPFRMRRITNSEV